MHYKVNTLCLYSTYILRVCICGNYNLRMHKHTLAHMSSRRRINHDSLFTSYLALFLFSFFFPVIICSFRVFCLFLRGRIVLTFFFGIEVENNKHQYGVSSEQVTWFDKAPEDHLQISSFHCYYFILPFALVVLSLLRSCGGYQVGAMKNYLKLCCV